MDKKGLSDALRKGSEDAIKDFLRKEPDFKNLEGRLLEQGPFSLDLLCSWILRRLTKITQEELIYDLEKFLVRDNISGNEVLIINRIILEKSFELSEDIRLVRFDEFISQSEFAQQLSNEVYRKTKVPQMLAVLICKNSNKPKFVDPEAKKYDAPFKKLITIAQLFTLVRCNSSVPLIHFFEPEPWVPYWLGISYTPFSAVIDPITPPDTFSQADKELFQNIYRLFNAFEDQKKLIIPLERLNQSILRLNEWNYINSSIEFGTAMEALFLPDSSDELSYKLSLRAAYFLGENPVERNELVTLFQKLYDFRSQAVHTGKIIIKRSELKKYEDLARQKNLLPDETSLIRERIIYGHDYMAKAIIKILTTGKYPNWNEVVLGL